MDAGQLATLAIVALLGFEKTLATMSCSLSESVKKLHLQCSSCCDVDLERATPPSSPAPQLSAPPSLAPPSRV